MSHTPHPYMPDSQKTNNIWCAVCGEVESHQLHTPPAERPHRYINDSLQQDNKNVRCAVCGEFGGHILHDEHLQPHRYESDETLVDGSHCKICGEPELREIHTNPDDEPDDEPDDDMSGVRESLHVCANCPYAVEAAVDPMNIGAPRPLECRADPPRAVLVPGAGGGTGMAGIHPPVKPTHWCGRHPGFVVDKIGPTILKTVKELVKGRVI